LDSHANTQPRGAIPAHVGEERVVEDGVRRLDVAARGPRNVAVSKVPGVRRRQQHAEDEKQQRILGHPMIAARAPAPAATARRVQGALFRTLSYPQAPIPVILTAIKPETTFHVRV
jgi:hypothetical protein